MLHSRRLFICLAALLVAAAAWAKSRPEPEPDPVMESDQPNAEKSALELPTLKNGPGKGNYVYYEARRYEAMVDPTGALHVFLLDDDGKRIGKTPWQLYPGISTWWSKIMGYREGSDRPIVKTFRRYMKKIADASDPTDDPRRTIEIKAILMDDVKYIRRYEFDRDSIRVWSGYDCPNEKHPSRFRLHVAFPACMTFAPSVPQEEREKKLKGYELKLVGRDASKKKREKQTMDYAVSEKIKMPWVEEIKAKGPWESRVVFIKAKDPILRPRKYPGKCLYQGYWFWSDVANKTTASSKQMEIAFEFE